jgi:integrase
LAQFVAEVAGGPPGMTHDGRVTVEAFARTWLAGCQAAVRVTTWGGYDQMCRRHIVPLLGSIPLRKLSYLDIDRCYARRLAEGFAPATIGQVHRVLHLICKAAQRAGHVQGNPAGLATPPRIERKAPPVLKDADKRRYLEAYSGTRLEAAAVLLLSCGMRRGELLALTWQEGAADFESGRLLITKSLIEARETRPGHVAKTRIMLVEPKTLASRRVIRLAPTAIEALARHRIRQREEHLRLGLGAPSFLFTRAGSAGPWRPSKFARAFSAIAARAGLKVYPHLMRHTHLTDLMAAGVHPRIAQSRAGHSSIAVTLNTYSHASAQMQDHAVDAAQAVLERARSA